MLLVSRLLPVSGSQPGDEFCFLYFVRMTSHALCNGHYALRTGSEPKRQRSL